MSKEITESENTIILKFKDEVSAFNGLKKAKIKNKGILSNKISALLFEYLESQNIKTHFIKLYSENQQEVEKVTMIPLEVIIRNLAAGDWMESLGFKLGDVLENPILELCYKDKKLKDPIVNDTHIKAMKIADEAVIKEIKEQALAINDLLIKRFDQCQIRLVDLKLEFGINKDNVLVLADSLSPDTIRLWDKESNQALDKDVFRKDLGKLDKAYRTVLTRMEETL